MLNEAEKTTYLIAPAWSDQAGQCRVVAKVGTLRNPLKDYRADPSAWRQVGIMNSQGELVCLDAPTDVYQEFKDCEPLMAGLVIEA